MELIQCGMKRYFQVTCYTYVVMEYCQIFQMFRFSDFVMEGKCPKWMGAYFWIRRKVTYLWAFSCILLFIFWIDKKLCLGVKCLSFRVRMLFHVYYILCNNNLLAIFKKCFHWLPSLFHCVNLTLHFSKWCRQRNF